MIDLADSHYAVDISKAKRLLGWEPRHSLRGTLREDVATSQGKPEAMVSGKQTGIAREADKVAQPRKQIELW